MRDRHPPFMIQRAASHAFGNTALSAIGLSVAKHAVGHPGLTGVALVEDGIDAFAIRSRLIAAAERSIDLQYYIWRDDLTGNLLLEDLRRAAARGVRVRLLVDDNGIPGLDRKLRWLASDRNFEIRIFNPFRNRHFKPLDFLLDFHRVNRRMHSKSFTVDNQITCVGGRNVGDEYFANREQGIFADVDTLCVGAVVQEVSECFDAFWNFPAPVEIDCIVKEDPKQYAASGATDFTRSVSGPSATDYLSRAAGSVLLERARAGRIEFEWVPVELVSDRPAKVLGQSRQGDLMASVLRGLIGQPERELLVVSGYFVPTSSGARAFAQMARKGVDVRVLTNSFASTDVAMVHAGYAKHRHFLVKSGVRLYEMPAPGDRPKTTRKSLRRPSPRNTNENATLHAKMFAVDGRRVFVGSFNFDPRSFALNTELGIVIQSENLAAQMHHAFDTMIASGSYKIVVDDKGRLNWMDMRDDVRQCELAEPGTTWWSRVLTRLLSKTPIDWLL